MILIERKKSENPVRTVTRELNWNSKQKKPQAPSLLNVKATWLLPYLLLQ